MQINIYSYICTCSSLHWTLVCVPMLALQVVCGAEPSHPCPLFSAEWLSSGDGGPLPLDTIILIWQIEWVLSLLQLTDTDISSDCLLNLYAAMTQPENSIFLVTCPTNKMNDVCTPTSWFSFTNLIAVVTSPVLLLVLDSCITKKNPCVNSCHPPSISTLPLTLSTRPLT